MPGLPGVQTSGVAVAIAVAAGEAGQGSNYAPGVLQESRRTAGQKRCTREESCLSSPKEPEEEIMLQRPSPYLLDHQERAIDEQEPLDALRRDAEALGVRLSISPARSGHLEAGAAERYYADWLDGEGRRQPALDTDIYLWTDPAGLIGRCLQAVSSQPGTRIVVLDDALHSVASISSVSSHAE